MEYGLWGPGLSRSLSSSFSTGSCVALAFKNVLILTRQPVVVVYGGCVSRHWWWYLYLNLWPCPMPRRHCIGGSPDERSDINANKLRQFLCVSALAFGILYHFVFVLPTPPYPPKSLPRTPPRAVLFWFFFWYSRCEGLQPWES